VVNLIKYMNEMRMDSVSDTNAASIKKYKLLKTIGKGFYSK
jgi:hypothetical protein